MLTSQILTCGLVHCTGLWSSHRSDGYRNISRTFHRDAYVSRTARFFNSNVGEHKVKSPNCCVHERLEWDRVCMRVGKEEQGEREIV